MRKIFILFLLLLMGGKLQPADAGWLEIEVNGLAADHNAAPPLQKPQTELTKQALFEYLWSQGKEQLTYKALSGGQPNLKLNLPSSMEWHGNQLYWGNVVRDVMGVNYPNQKCNLDAIPGVSSWIYSDYYDYWAVTHVCNSYDPNFRACERIPSVQNLAHRNPDLRGALESNCPVMISFLEELDQMMNDRIARAVIQAKEDKETFLKWSRNGFSQKQVADWQQSGFSLEEATAWKSKGIYVASTAESWQQKGFNPTMAQAWVLARFNVFQALQWKAEGFSAEEAAAWFGEKIEPKEAMAWKQQGIEPFDAGLLKQAKLGMEELNAWKPTGFSPAEMVLWNGAGFGPMEALVWREVLPSSDSEPLDESKVRELARWKNAGILPEEALLWMKAQVTDPALPLQWRQFGFDATQAFAWQKAGVQEPVDAQRMAAKGLSPSDKKGIAKAWQDWEWDSLVEKRQLSAKDKKAWEQSGFPLAYRLELVGRSFLAKDIPALKKYCKNQVDFDQDLLVLWTPKAAEGRCLYFGGGLLQRQGKSAGIYGARLHDKQIRVSLEFAGPAPEGYIGIVLGKKPYKDKHWAVAITGEE